MLVYYSTTVTTVQPSPIDQVGQSLFLGLRATVAVAGLVGASGCQDPESTPLRTDILPRYFIFTTTQPHSRKSAHQKPRYNVLVYATYETKGRHTQTKHLIQTSNLAQPTGPNTQNPMHQQQTRSLTANQPRNQMEAMPPNQSPGLHTSPQSTATPFNPAIVHPVFFSQAWRKAPYPLPGTTGFSPVATGYVFGAPTATRKEPLTKL